MDKFPLFYKESLNYQYVIVDLNFNVENDAT